jgi:hypothetical protein
MEVHQSDVYARRILSSDKAKWSFHEYLHILRYTEVQTNIITVGLKWIGI